MRALRLEFPGRSDSSIVSWLNHSDDSRFDTVINLARQIQWMAMAEVPSGFFAVGDWLIAYDGKVHGPFKTEADATRDFVEKASSSLKSVVWQVGVNELALVDDEITGSTLGIFSDGRSVIHPEDARPAAVIRLHEAACSENPTVAYPALIDCGSQLPIALPCSLFNKVCSGKSPERVVNFSGRGSPAGGESAPAGDMCMKALFDVDVDVPVVGFLHPRLVQHAIIGVPGLQHTDMLLHRGSIPTFRHPEDNAVAVVEHVADASVPCGGAAVGGPLSASAPASIGSPSPFYADLLGVPELLGEPQQCHHVDLKPVTGAAVLPSYPVLGGNGGLVVRGGLARRNRATVLDLIIENTAGGETCCGYSCNPF